MVAQPKRIFRIERLPIALLQAFALLAISATWLWGFSRFWTFMVIELPQDLGPYSQMSSLSMFMHRAFPMRETNDTAFKYKFDHIVILALVFVVLMMAWTPTRAELREKNDKTQAKAKKEKAATTKKESL